MNRLLIIDGNAMMHRAYHAIPPLTAPDGSIVNVVYGFASMLFRLHESLAPSHMAVTFDRPTPTFRKTLYTGYQSKRPKMEDTLISQIPKVHELVESFGIPIFEKDGFEADDVIGTLCQQVKSQKSKVESQIDQVVIVTGDRDILQLVEKEKILVYMPTKGISEGKIYHSEEVVERLGVRPDQIPDLKGLAGDSSDNYPGVEGIGPKTAIDLIKTYNTIEELYMKGDKGNWEGVKASVQEKLRKGRDMAFLSKDLATIRINVDMQIALHPVLTLNTEASRNELMKFHFHSLLKRLGTDMNILSDLQPAKNEKEAEKQEEHKSEQQTLF